MRVETDLFEDGEDLLPIRVFFCNGENCKNYELNNNCKRENELIEDFKNVIVEWSNNSSNIICPKFEYIT